MTHSGAAIGTIAALCCLPLVLSTPYQVHVAIMVGIYIVLALSYDLTVGHIGLLSFAHPVFFGAGAYLAAILAVTAGWQLSFPLMALLAALVAAVLGIVIGVPSLRLSHHSFAIGTLGFTLIGGLIATNWIPVTQGPMCVAGVPNAVLSLPGTGTFSFGDVRSYYYLILTLVVLTILFYRALTTSRIGRAFHTVRDNEVLAQASGVNPWKYKMVSFVVGAAIAGGVGVFYAYYIGVVCPSEVSLYYMINLLVIVFLGGAGSLWGIIFAAIIFTAVPESLRVAPDLRLLIYGVILLVAITYMPQGLGAATTTGWRRLRLIRSLHARQVVDSAYRSESPITGDRP